MENIIEIKNLKKYFGEIKAVDDISFEVHKGSLFAFLGLKKPFFDYFDKI